MIINWPPKNAIKLKGEIWKVDEEKSEAENQAKELSLFAFCFKIITMKK